MCVRVRVRVCVCVAFDVMERVCKNYCFSKVGILSFQGSDVTMDVSTATTMIAADIVALTSTTRRCRNLCLTTIDVLAGELCTAVALVTNASLCLEAVVSVTIMLVDNSVKSSH